MADIVKDGMVRSGDMAAGREDNYTGSGGRPGPMDKAKNMTPKDREPYADKGKVTKRK